MFTTTLGRRATALGTLLLSAALTCAAPVDPAPGEFVNSIGMRFVRIPAGRFEMGAADEDREAGANEKPRHAVTISQAFYLGQFEVTQAQWLAVMGSSPFALDRSNPFYDLPGMPARLNHPQNPATVSWNDVQQFIQRLNQREGHTRYRLPTEAEWEYAARAGTTSAYSFGDDARELGRYAWYGENFATGSTHAVGQKLPNPWGLYDVHGNVWEWVQDWYAERYAAAAVTDPGGPTSGSSKVVRGGSWHETSGSWRTSFRKPYTPTYRGISIGFRLAMSLERPLYPRSPLR